MWRTRRTRDIAQLGSSATEDSGVAIGAAADATAQDGVEEGPRAGSTSVAATAFSTASTAMGAATVSPGAFCKRVKKSQERILRPRLRKLPKPRMKRLIPVSVPNQMAMWRTRRTRDIAQLGSSATEDSGVAIGAAADATAQDGVVAVVAVCARST